MSMIYFNPIHHGGGDAAPLAILLKMLLKTLYKQVLILFDFLSMAISLV